MDKIQFTTFCNLMQSNVNQSSQVYAVILYPVHLTFSPDPYFPMKIVVFVGLAAKPLFMIVEE